MKNEATPPEWNPEDKAASLLAYAEWLHGEAVRMFLEDGTHGQILFLFTDDGVGSINPVPAGTDPARLVAGVRRAVKEHGLYGVITVAEAWTYIPKHARDHTAIQIVCGEMNVSDLNEGDRSEALMLRMESRDGGHMTWIDPIVRDGTVARLADGMALTRDKCLRMESYFDGG